MGPSWPKEAKLSKAAGRVAAAKSERDHLCLSPGFSSQLRQKFTRLGCPRQGEALLAGNLNELWSSTHLPGLAEAPGSWASQVAQQQRTCLSTEEPQVPYTAEKEMATHSSMLAWEIPWTEEPGGLQSMGLQKS